MESGLTATPANSFRTLDAFCQVPWTYLYSGSSGDPKPYLLLQWEGLFSPSPCCAVPSTWEVWEERLSVKTAFFLPFSLTRLSHAGLLPSLTGFLHLGIKSSCALWKVSLKICQLCSAPLSLRAVSQGILLSNSLNSWKFAFLKFRVVSLLFGWLLSLRNANSTRAWSLQPRLPPVLKSPI